MRRIHAGFTLIEVLIALVIIAIALTAVLTATMDNTSKLGYLEEKTVAHWVAMNVMTQVQLASVNRAPLAESNSGESTMLTQKMYWQYQIKPTDNDNVAQVIVNVATKEKSESIVSLTGYILSGNHYVAQ